MALPNDGVLQTEGAGTTIATNLTSSKEYAVLQEATPFGMVAGSTPTYYMQQVPRPTTAAATDYVDLFNASGSGVVVVIRGIYPIVSTIGTGVLATATTIDWQVFRTSAVGTGGTTNTYASNTLGAAGTVNVTPQDTNNAALPAQVTARGVPTGGATADDFLFTYCSPLANTNAATFLQAGIDLLPQFAHNQGFRLQVGQGVKIRQATATATGPTNGIAFGFMITFSVV